jgi:predicted nucleic acid-binding protein
LIAGAPLPADVYLDTSIVLTALLPGLAHSGPGLQFCEQLARQGSTVYFSQLLRLEIAQALRNVATRSPAQLSVHLRQQFQLDPWSAREDVRRGWMTYGRGQLEAFIQQFVEVIELPFDRATWEHSIDLMCRYQLKSYDAVHVARAEQYGLQHVATTDREYLVVQSPRIWLIRDPTP